MDAKSPIVHLKSESIYGEPVRKRFDISNSEVKTPLTKGKIKKEQIDLMKDELRGKIMKKFVALRLKMYNYLTDGRCIYKKAKDTKNSNLRTRKSVWKVTRQYWGRNKGSWAGCTIYLWKKSAKVPLEQMMLRDYRRFIK